MNPPKKSLSLRISARHRARPIPPKPWNRHAVTAEYWKADTCGGDNHICFLYTLQNNTDEDFRLGSSYVVDIAATLKPQKSFGSFADKQPTLEYPVFVPARSRALAALVVSTYRVAGRPDDAKGLDRFRAALVAKIVEDMPNVDGVVLFDETDRYQIDFPGGWLETAKAGGGHE